MPPTSYSAWTQHFDRFASGDDAVLADIVLGTFEWSNVAAERFIRQASDALRKRLELLSDALQKRLSRATNLMEVRAALTAAQQQLAPLHAFSSAPGFDERLRNHLSEECRKWTERTRTSLESSASSGRDEEGLRVIRAAAPKWPPPADASQPAERELSTTKPQNPAPSGRRVIL